MDLCDFRPLKLMWAEEIIKWQRRNYARKLPKSEFSSIISKIWKNISPNIIQNGFKKAGIFPFCDSVVSKEKFEPEAYRRWSSFKESQEAATMPSTSNAEGAAILPATSNARAATLPSTSHAERAAILPATSNAGAATLPSTSHAERAAILPATSNAEGAAILPATSNAGVATLPSTSHAERDAILPATSNAEGGATLPSTYQLVKIKHSRNYS
jgi:cytidine deaminase